MLGTTNSTTRILKSGSISLLLLLPFCGFAASVKIVLPVEAPRAVWVLPKLPEKLPENGREFDAKEFVIEIPDSLSSGILLLGEMDTGNYASIRVQEVLGKGIWRVTDESWVVGRVSVSVAVGAQPVDGVMVVLTRGDHQKSALAVEGDASFYFVSFGRAEIYAEYSDGREKKRTTPEPIDLALNREQPIPTAVIALPSDAIVNGKQPVADTGGEGKEEAGQKERSRSFPIGNLIYYVLAVLLAAGALWYLYRFLKQNDTKVMQQLRNLGIEPIEASDDAPTPAAASAPPLEPEPLVPAGHCQYCGEAVDASGICSCSRAAASTAPGVGFPVPTAAAGLRLKSDDGTIFEIPEGTTRFGREGQLAVADPTVSRAHAEFNRTGSRVTVKDLASANGTFVNGAKLLDEVELRAGDQIQFGAYRMRVEQL